MNAPHELLADAAAAGLLLTRSGDKLHVESVFGAAPPDDLQRRLGEHRDELLAWLAWEETADALLLESSRRIAARYPDGCPLDDPQWEAADQALHAAYHSCDTETLRRELVRHERFAFEMFTRFEGVS